MPRRIYQRQGRHDYGLGSQGNVYDDWYDDWDEGEMKRQNAESKAVQATMQEIAINETVDIISFRRGGKWRVNRVTRERWANGGGSQVSEQIGEYDTEDAARARMRESARPPKSPATDPEGRA
jgi:hypothetical protein